MSARCSVIVPAYNAAPYIEEALASIFNQGIPDLEILVVDDASTDDTAAKVAPLAPRVRLIRHERNSGSPGATRNTGLAQATGEYICFLDADDIMAPRRVSQQAEILDANANVGAVFVDYRNFSTEGPADRTHFQTCPLLTKRLAGKSRAVLGSAEATQLLLQENFAGAGTAMIRRDALRVAPSFSTDFRVGEDFHFFYRIAREYAVGIVNEVGIQRRLHGSNVTGDSLRSLEDFILSRRALRDTETNPVNAKLLDACLCDRQISLARAHANRRRFGTALACNVTAMTSFFPASLQHWKLGTRTLLRTAAMAAGIWKSDS